MNINTIAVVSILVLSCAGCGKSKEVAARFYEQAEGRDFCSACLVDDVNERRRTGVQTIEDALGRPPKIEQWYICPIDEVSASKGKVENAWIVEVKYKCYKHGNMIKRHEVIFRDGKLKILDRIR